MKKGAILVIITIVIVSLLAKISAEEIMLNSSWHEDDIINGDDFTIKVSAQNLLDEKYDLRIYIYNDDDSKVYSEFYDKNQDKWLSGVYYYQDFFNGPGNKSKSIDLRINEDYRKFKGDATLVLKLKESDSSAVKKETEYEIYIIKAKSNSTTSSSTTSTKSNSNSNYTSYQEYIKKLAEEIEKNGTLKKMTGSPVVVDNSNKNDLETEDIKTQDNVVVYESTSQMVKRYSIYTFIFLLSILCLLLLTIKLAKR